MRRTPVNKIQVIGTFPIPEINMSISNNFSINSKKIQSESNSDIKERPTLLQNLKNYFSQYCMSTGVHGVRYLGESGRFIIEK